MGNYYFLNAALPPLSIGTQPELSFKELRVMLEENLSPADWKEFTLLLRPIDLSNIRAFWMGLPMDERGNYTPKELEEALLVPDHLPDYLVEFLERYDSVEQRLRYFPSLYASLFRETQSVLKGFLLQYYIFERDLRLVLTGLRAKKLGRDVARELQFEDPTDPIVAGILAQKDAPEYEPPVEYQQIKDLFLAHGEKPKELHRALLEARFAKYEELEENQPFSLDRVLSYVARLLIVESYEGLKEEQGRAIMEDLSKYG